MTPRMYDSRWFTMAEIAASCGVTSMRIYRNTVTGAASAQAACRSRRLRGHRSYVVGTLPKGSAGPGTVGEGILA